MVGALGDVTAGPAAAPLLIHPGELTLDDLQACPRRRRAGGARPRCARRDPRQRRRGAPRHRRRRARCTASTPASASSPRTRIARDDLELLQLKLHPLAQRGRGRAAAPRGGAPDPAAEGGEPGARLLGRARGGGRRLLALHNAGLVPVIPCQGSVGASGDLAPLAHLCLPADRRGRGFFEGGAKPGRQALERAPASRRCSSAPRRAWR